METQEQKTQNCITINRQLQSAIQLQGTKSLSPFDSERIRLDKMIAYYRKQLNDNNCVQLIERQRQAELGSVINKFSALDKERIEAESIYERNQRVFFGALILISSIVIVTMFEKK